MRLKNKFNLTFEIPTSSQSDIDFLLIIFFIITAIFFERTGLSFKLPSKNTKPLTVSSNEIIEIKLFNDKIIVNNKEIDFFNLKDFLEPLCSKKSKNIIVIFFDKKLKYKNFIKVFQVIKKIENVKVSIKKL